MTIMGTLHVAIIMDGNGRWAEQQGWPRTTGHRAGAEAVRRAVEASPALGITTLTLYAFSSDNWKRPPGEVRTLMTLFGRFLRNEIAECQRNSVKLTVIGRRDRLPSQLVRDVERAERETALGKRIHLRIAVDYSARDAILRAVASSGGQQLTRDGFSELLAAACNEKEGTPDVDLLIRTGREQRLSDFLLWESAYAELLFIDRLWPDFTGDDLRDAVQSFRRRDRRFGTIRSTALPDAAIGAGR